MAGPVRLLGDDALVRAARSGSDDAFAEIVRRHAPRLQRQCRRIVGPERADDALQQALTGALLALRRPGDRRSIDLERWLGRIARNASIDVLRRSIPDWSELDERIDGVRRPPEVAADRERLRTTFADIQALPERQRRAIVLHAFEGRSWEEIAHELDVGEPAVRQLLHRARTRLRDVAAVLVGPFWLLRPAGARAAGLLAGAAGGGGLKAAAGVTVALVVAGGTVAEVTGPSHRVSVSSALAVADAAAAASPRGDPVTVDDGPATDGRPARGHGRRHAARVPKPRSGARRHAPRGGEPAPAAFAPKRREVRRRIAPAAPAVSPAASAPADRTPAQEPVQAAPELAPEPAAPAPATPDPPAPSVTPPTPAGPPAPAAIGRIVQWAPGPGAGGLLRIEGLPTGNETAPVGELTSITCVHAEAGVVISSGPCTPAQIAVGGQVSVADRAFSATAGTIVWTTLQLLR